MKDYRDDQLRKRRRERLAHALNLFSLYSIGVVVLLAATWTLGMFAGFAGGVAAAGWRAGALLWSLL